MGMGCYLKKIGDDVIAQKAMTSFKQIARHRMEFFEIDLFERFSQKYHITLLYILFPTLC
jgi:hypothetical protein